MKFSITKKTLFFLLGLGISTACAQQKIPEPLKAWEDWATWDAEHYHCPTAFNDANRYFCFCPSEVSLQAGAKEGRFSLAVTAFHKTWFLLPGDADLWPLNVQADGKPLAVVERNGRPATLLSTGAHRLSGDFRWTEMPQKIRWPAEYGVVSLAVEGKAVAFPNQDEDGFLWLKREKTGEGDRDFLGVQVYRLIEDGIPMWLNTTLELSVAGKSREVELGDALPEGWSLSSVESPIPVAVDEQGRVKAQVRAGKWLVQMRAFRATHAPELKMKSDARLITERELVGFKADPEFRMLDIRNATAVDVSQTTFPQPWRPWPVYQWTVKTPLALEEKMRGSGLQTPKSLTGARELWLNENGRGYTYRDQLTGAMQSIWRLDAPPALQLGSVRVNGEGQLITRNPKTGATGVEIRARNLRLEAMGTAKSAGTIPATGWNADVDALTLTLNLPPGWRLLALFGAESVDGDWLTSWTLLDLFLLLIFSLAIYRLWGIGAGVIAFLAFGLTYHEPGSPCYAWLFLLMPLALLRVAPEGKLRKVIAAWKWLALLLLAIALIPFTYWQIQSVIYPQLEMTGRTLRGEMGQYKLAELSSSETTVLSVNAAAASPAPPPAAAQEEGGEEGDMGRLGGRVLLDVNASSAPLSKAARGRARQAAKAQYSQQQQMNLAYEPKAKIQTGPGVPDWHWRAAICHWRGPVAASQNITPILLPPWARKIVVLAGLALIFWLLARLLEIKRLPLPTGRRPVGAAFP